MTAQFPTTQWSIIEQIRRAADDESRREIYGNLYRRYWLPLYAFARGSGHDHEAARDLTQDFFLRAMKQDLFSRADAAKGKLRTFLLAVFKADLIDHDRSRRRLKRGGSSDFQAMELPDFEPENFSALPADTLPPQDLYDFVWAKTLLSHCFETLRGEYQQAGKEKLFEALHPTLTETSTEPAAAAEALSMNPGTYRVAVSRLRRRFGQLVRNEVAATVPPDSSIKEELADLKRILESSHGLLD